MDGVSIAASIVGIAGAGAQISIKLVTLATQISTASERVSSIGNDISLTAGVLHQLAELMTQKTTEDGISIFSKGGLETTKTSAAVCERIFHEVEKEAKKASEQLSVCKRLEAGKIKLSKVEKAKWPFLQPSIDTLRADLREAKGTLILMLQISSLALSKRMADNQSTSANTNEQRDFMRAIVALQRQQDAQNSCSRGTNPCKAESTATPSKENQVFTFGCSQPSALPVGLKIYRDLIHKEPLKSTAFPTYAEMNAAKDINSAKNTDASIAAFQMSSLPAPPWLIRSGGQSPPEFERSISSSPRPEDEQTKMELHLFLIKPIVKDYFDKIELTWSLHNTRMQQLAIQTYVQEQEKDGIPSVTEMLLDLHAYEQDILDTELQSVGAGFETTLLTLKRTKSDLRHRDITFKDVPGLQFVIKRPLTAHQAHNFSPPMMRLLNARQEQDSLPTRTYDKPEDVICWSGSKDSWYSIDSGLGTDAAPSDPASIKAALQRSSPFNYSTIVNDSTSHTDLSNDCLLNKSESKQFLRSHDEHGQSFEPATSVRPSKDSASGEEEEEEEEEGAEEFVEAGEEGEDAVVARLLEKYTTLFD